jgi:hypothetical protein
MQAACDLARAREHEDDLHVERIVFEDGAAKLANGPDKRKPEAGASPQDEPDEPRRAT